MQENKVAAGVVLYHPDFNVITNISTYYKSIDKLVVIDNTETADTSFQNDLHKLFPDVVYIFLNRNAGIAAALNIACEIAIQNGCSWILTMDQDSSFIDNQLSQMRGRIPKIESHFQRVGIISPYHVLHENDAVKATQQYRVKNIAMTSGNLLNLNAYMQTGTFEEKLFMDFVDYEYCLRLRKNKYQIIQDNFVHLKHSLGNYHIKKLFNQTFGVSNHNSVRRYYMTRNSLYVAFKYIRLDTPFFLYTLRNVFLWDLFIITFFENDKVSKIRSVLKGISHFLFNKFGKIV